jgi:hypothetical protein
MIEETRGELSVKRAKQKAMETWTNLKPKPPAADVVTFENVLEQFIENRKLSGKMAPRPRRTTATT